MWGGHHGMGMLGGNLSNLGWFGWVVMILQMLIPLILMGAVIYFLYKLGSRKLAGAGSSDALSILNVRYAKNEITTEEYKRIKEELIR